MSHSRVSNQAGKISRIALIALLSSGFSGVAAAQEASILDEAAATETVPVEPIRKESATELDTVEVTGSRIKRVQAEGPLPITVIGRADIDASGDLTVSDYLRRLDFNSFGSFSASSGQSGGAQGGAQISLRGLGEERTLLLVDGRRVPASPAFAGAAANLNIVPLALVERVEILREGASAIYGSDAIGGVINIITRKNYEGMQLSGTLERPQLEGGDAASTSLVWGTATDKSNLYFSLDHSQKGIVYMRDRDYSRGLNSAIGNPGTILFASDPVTGDEVVSAEGAFANCPEAFDTDPNFPDSARVGDFCRYRFASVAGQTAGISRDTLSLGGNYNFAPEVTGFLQTTMTRAQSFGRFAAAPVTNPLTIAADNPNNPTNPNNPNGVVNPDCPNGCDLAFIFRPTDNGTRDSTVVDTVTQVLAGLKGNLDFMGYSAWEVGLTHNRYLQREIGTGFGLARELQQAVDSGEYNPFDTTSPTNSGRSFDYTTTTNNAFISKGIDAQISLENVLGDLYKLPLVVGAEYRREDFQTISDAQSAQSITFDANGNITSFVESNVFGSSGGSSQGARDYYAVYAESAVDLFDSMLNVDVALRYDSYSVGGGRLSPKLSLGYRPIDDVLVRASVSQGFRAPDLTSLFGSPSQSFEDAVDRVGCDADPTNAEACEVVQRKTAFDSNPTLKPETSNNYNVGLIYSITQDLSLSLDVYRIELKDAITQLEVQAVLDNEFRCAQDGRTCSTFSEGAVVRNADGTIDFVYSPATNAARIETQGIDFAANYGLLLPWGKLDTDFTLGYVDSYKQQDSAQGELLERIDTIDGTFSRPKFRSTLVLGWSLEEYSANFVTRYIHGFRDCAPLDVQVGDASCSNSVSSFTTFDGQVGWAAPWKGEFVLGVRNLLGRDPPISSFRRGATDSGVDYELHSFEGRVPFLRYTQSF